MVQLRGLSIWIIVTGIIILSGYLLFKIRKINEPPIGSVSKEWMGERAAEVGVDVLVTRIVYVNLDDSVYLFEGLPQGAGTEHLERLSRRSGDVAAISEDRFREKSGGYFGELRLLCLRTKPCLFGYHVTPARSESSVNTFDREWKEAVKDYKGQP
jgi:hypothetical protein